MSTTSQTASVCIEQRFVPRRVRLSARLVNDFCFRQQETEHGSSNGLLFGRVSGHSVSVEAFQCFGGREREDYSPPGEGAAPALCQWLAAANTIPELRTLKLLGWFAIRTNGNLSASEFRFYNRPFRRLSDIALVVNSREKSKFSAVLYIRAPETITTAEPCRYTISRISSAIPAREPVDLGTGPELESDLYAATYRKVDTLNRLENQLRRWQTIFSAFKLKKRSGTFAGMGSVDSRSGPAMPEASRRDAGSTRLLREGSIASGPANLPAARCSAEAKPLQVSESNRPPAPALSAGHKVGFLRAVTLGVGLGIVFGFILGGNARLKDMMSFVRLQAADSAGSILNLQSSSRADGLLVTWDHENPVVRFGVTGLLQIIDGTQKHLVRLDSMQLNHGEILYKPYSADVTFELEVTDDRNHSANATIRLIDGTKLAGTASAVNQPEIALPTRATTLPQPSGKLAAAGVQRRSIPDGQSGARTSGLNPRQ